MSDVSFNAEKPQNSVTCKELLLVYAEFLVKFLAYLLCPLQF